MNTRIIHYRPPRIAMALVIFATALHFAAAADFFELYSSWPAGVAAAVLGFVLMIGAWWQFRQREVLICPTEPTAQLITDGCYRLTRNPMYLGIVLMMLGLSLTVGTLPFYLATMLFALIIDRHFCRYEEQKLRDTFAAEFDAYAARVRRWL